jgi:predicted AAA+ superfamily ATPase
LIQLPVRKLRLVGEEFALEEVIFSLGVEADDCYYWCTQTGAELDLLVFKEGKRMEYEFKYTDAPKVMPSMRIALKDLSLDTLTVVVPGKATFPLHEQISVVGLSSLQG